MARRKVQLVRKREQRDKLQISDQHAVKMDSAVRESLAIISRIDACAAAVINTMPQMPDATSALTERALRSIGGGIADLARLQIGLSYQITLHRRDTALWDTKKSGISTRDMLKLRHGPFLSQELLMDPDILSEIAEKRQADAQKRAIMKVASASTAQLVQVASPQRHETPKRSLQLPEPDSQAKKGKQASPRKETSSTLSDEESPQSTPKSKSHR